MVHPEVKNWIKYANFEDKHGYIARGRKVFERGVEFFGEEHISENLYVAFARFEEKQKEVRPAFTLSNKHKSSCRFLLTCSLCVFQFERVRVIYKYALDRIPKQQAQELFKNYTVFEKRFGDRRGIEDVIVSKRRFQYEEEVKVCKIFRGFSCVLS